MSQEFFTKDVEYDGLTRSILIQNENGPCALLALANYLILKGVLSNLSTDTGIVDSDLIVASIAEYITDTHHGRSDVTSGLLDTLHGLVTGMHVNVGFGSPTRFEETPEVRIFSLVGAPLFHLWVASPEDTELYPYLFDIYYDKAVETVATASDSSNPEVLAIKSWLDATPTQMTVDGIEQVGTILKDDSLGVVFINNHLSTITKHCGCLYALVTDAGFADRQDVVWEALDQVDGDTRLVDAFRAPKIIPRPIPKKKRTLCFIC